MYHFLVCVDNISFVFMRVYSCNLYGLHGLLKIYKLDTFHFIHIDHIINLSCFYHIDFLQDMHIISYYICTYDDMKSITKILGKSRVFS